MAESSLMNGQLVAIATHHLRACPTLKYAGTWNAKQKHAQAIHVRMTAQVGQMVAVSIMEALALALSQLRVKNEYQWTQDDKAHVRLTKVNVQKGCPS